MMPQTNLPTPAPIKASPHPAATAAKPAALLLKRTVPKPPVDFLEVVVTPAVEGGNIATILRGTSDLHGNIKWTVVGAGKTNRFVLPNNRGNQYFQAANVITNL